MQGASGTRLRRLSLSGSPQRGERFSSKIEVRSTRFLEKENKK